MKLINFLNNNLSSGAVLVAALMIANVLNFLFNAILGRVLSLEEFSILTLVNTLWFLITIFLNSLASTTTNRTAYLATKRGEAVAQGFRKFIQKQGIYISIILSILWLLLIPIFSLIFHAKDYFLFFLLTPTISLGILTAINRGHFQGTLAFTRAAATIIAESVSKLLIVIILIVLGFKQYAYLSIPLSIFVAFITSYWFVIRFKKQKKVSYNYLFPRKLLLATFIAAFSSAAFLSVDLLLARYYLSAKESGAYSLLSLVGKMVYFFGGIFSVFILIFASRDTGLNKNSTKNFYKLLSINIVLLAIGFIGLGVFGKTFVPLFFGAKTEIILNFLTPYTLGIALFSLATAFATYHLAKQQFIFAYNGILAMFFMIVGLVLQHKGIGSFTYVILISSFYYLASNLLLHVFYKDFSEYVDEEDTRKFWDFENIKRNSLTISICIPAHNEAKNIGKLLNKLLNQETRIVQINKIVVVSSGSTDKTNVIVKKIAKENPNVILITEKERTGKASAINAFLKIVNDPVVVVQSADTLPMENTIEMLCRSFKIDRLIGMTGGAPTPLNDPNTFLGFVIHTWWWFHRNIPRFGEIIAFKNIIGEVSPRTSVDEAYIQAKFAQMGFKIVHIDEAKIYNKGSESIRDMIKQRRRIFNGHTRLKQEENIHISHVSKSGIKLLLFDYKMYGPMQLIWLMGGITIELWANILGRYDKYVNKLNPVVWDIAKSTKNLKKTKGGRVVKW